MVEEFIANPVIWAVVIIILLLFIVVSRYRKPSPDKALIISGALLGSKNVYKDPNGSKRIKIIQGGGTFLIPVLQSAKELSMSSLQIQIETPEINSQQQVPIAVTGAVNVKVGNSLKEIATAAEQFLGKEKQKIISELTAVLEGGTRDIIGRMTVEEILGNREKFSQEVQGQVSDYIENMGFQIISFTLQEIKDSNGYIESLGKPQIATVRQEAQIAEANADREVRIKKASAEQEATKAELERETEIADAQKEKSLKMADYQKQQEVAKADAEKAAMLAQKGKDIAEQEQNIAIQAKEADLKRKQYEAESNTKADADLYVAKQSAEAEKARQIAQAEAQAEQIKLQADADAERTAKLGKAEAERIRQVGLAQAESTEKQAEALAKMNEAGKLQMIIDKLPEIATALTAPYANVDKIVQFSGAGDDSIGNAGVTGLTKTFAMVKEATGIDFAELINGSLTQQAGNKPVVAAIEAAAKEKALVPSGKDKPKQ